jgi:hypothetical protein
MNAETGENNGRSGEAKIALIRPTLWRNVMNGRAHIHGHLAACSVLVVAMLELAGCAATQPYVVTQQSTRISEPEIHARIKAANPKYSGAGKVLKDDYGVIWGIEISESSVTTLEPLRGMQLTALSCSQNDISDLAPLKGMKLLQLVLDDDPITDLSPRLRHPFAY